MENQKEKGFLSEINQNKKVLIILMAVIFLITFLLNHLTPRIADDYAYRFSFYDGEKIESVKDIVYSMQSHYLYMNGRLVSHSIVHFVDMLPDVMFDVMNSFIFVLFLLMLYCYCREQEKHNVFLLAILMAGIWKYVPVYGQV